MRCINIFIIILLLGISNGCATKRTTKADLRTGQLGKAQWPDCILDAKHGMVHCKCSDFNATITAKGITVLRCTK